MGCVIAMAGKGGTGKTTIAGLIVIILKEQKSGSILAIDADPDSNLSELLGLEAKESIGSILDDLAAHPENVPSGMGKDAFIEYRVQSAIAEAEGYDILTMGRPEGPGCYCYVNNALRHAVSRLVDDYDFVIIDNEAGLEHLSRRTTRSADSLVIVADPSAAGLRAAKRISALARELKIKIKREFLIINRAKAEVSRGEISIPFDAAIEKISLNGDSLLKLEGNSVSLKTLRSLGAKIWQCN